MVHLQLLPLRFCGSFVLFFIAKRESFEFLVWKNRTVIKWNHCFRKDLHFVFSFVMVELWIFSGTWQTCQCHWPCHDQLRLHKNSAKSKNWKVIIWFGAIIALTLSEHWSGVWGCINSLFDAVMIIFQKFASNGWHLLLLPHSSGSNFCGKTPLFFR